jgi:TolB-like protein
MILRNYFLLFLIGMAGPILAGQSEPTTLAVNDLAAQGVKVSDAAVISEQLRAELMRSPKIRLIERTQMQEILKEQGFQQSGCTSDACAVEIGQMIGVRNMIVGSVGVAGSYTILSVRVIDVSTGGIIANESIRTKGGIDNVVEKGIAEASDKLLSDLFPETKEQKTEKPAEVRRKPHKAIFIGCGAALLAGGGIAAAVLMKKDNSPESPNAANTRIELP